MASSNRIVPCLWFEDQAEKAASFYTRIFPDGRIRLVTRYPEAVATPSTRPRGSVLTVEVELAGQRFTLLNGGPEFVPNPSLSFFVHVDTAAEANRLFGVLVDGGEALMPIDRYPWSERYGWVKDRFGISWQVMAGQRARGAATIVPSLMFVGALCGKAEAAIRTYVEIFANSRVGDLERYAAGEGPVGAIKHGRFVLAGQELVAMDGPGEHAFRFNEALSLQVMCKDQSEVDRYWSALVDGGVASECGWLKDKFGFSWQIVPEGFEAWLTSTDTAARDRTFAALLTMQKLDIAALQRAYAGS